jgi:superfamily II DNA/RNA helicase
VRATLDDRIDSGRDEIKARKLLPNVRLANGEVRHETRRRLLLTFNTPLFPEILIASSVLAEGVDLHLNCRYVIHHDLSWNPSTLEQRSGRVDRIGCKAEQVRQPIHLYLPYVAETQDEKMFRVVRDRERWFQIVMGETYEVDEAATDARAARVPLPAAVQQELAMRLRA